MDLSGQVVLITGGSRGLGRAFAQALLAAGARVAITARSAPELHETAAQLSSAADQVVAIPADATDPGAAPKVVATAEERLGPITLLINNAGQSRAVGPIRAVDPIAWWNEVEVKQWYQALYAEGRDTPIDRSVELVLRLAGGDADALSGRYLSVDDDLDALVKQFAAEPSADQRTLRLHAIAPLSTGALLAAAPLARKGRRCSARAPRGAGEVDSGADGCQPRHAEVHRGTAQSGVA